MFGGSKGADGVRVTELADPVSASDREANLRELVRNELSANEARSGSASAELVARRPYYFREYAEYRGASGDFELDFRERDSRTAPYAAEVAYDKLRYSTRLHRNREQARADSNFLRDTGRETVSYEMRNGEWRKVGSFFVADRTEEQVDGEWVAVNESVLRTVVAEEPSRRGLWDRVRFWR